MQDIVDPIEFAGVLWPDVTFYNKQREIIYSVLNDDETYVPAGNMLGKDFVAGFIALWFFLSRHPCRVVTTSVNDKHINILWGEIGSFIQESKYPPNCKKGGCLVVNHHSIKKVRNGEVCPKSELSGQVAKEGEALQGAHIDSSDGIPRTLFIVDEASGIPEMYYTMATGWAKRILILGNPWECQNFFRKGVDRGNVRADDNGHFHSRVIKISAEDCPNVRLARAQEKAGRKPTGETLVPGVLGWRDYLKRRKLWGKKQQCVGLDGEFYQGPDEMMFPPEWLNLAEQKAMEMAGTPRRAKAIGIDPAMGGDDTAMAAVDEYGLIELVWKKTPDTTVITSEAIAFMRKHKVEPENVLFDAGGGGTPHAHRLHGQGYNVQAIPFGASASPDRRIGRTWLSIRKEEDEVRYAYKNRRAEMYWLLRMRLDPSLGDGFTIPAEYVELRQELRPIMVEYDQEGRLALAPKNKPISTTGKESTVRTLTELIGHSPDRADALVLAVFGMEERFHVQEAQFS